MANRAVRDAITQVSSFALPSALSLSTTSAVIDLGTDAWKSGNHSINMAVPSLTSTMNPSAATGGVTYIIETSTTSAFTAVARTIYSKTIAGSTSSTPSTVCRARAGEDCERYVRGKVTFAATTADASTISADFYLAN